jgi:hypothetical protein
MRDAGKPQGADGEKFLSVDHPEWRKTATKLAETGIGIDYFIAAPGGAYVDISTIGRRYHVGLFLRGFAGANISFQATPLLFLVEKYSSIPISTLLETC